VLFGSAAGAIAFGLLFLPVLASNSYLGILSGFLSGQCGYEYLLCILDLIPLLKPLWALNRCSSIVSLRDSPLLVDLASTIFLPLIRFGMRSVSLTDIGDFARCAVWQLMAHSLAVVA